MHNHSRRIPPAVQPLTWRHIAIWAALAVVGWAVIIGGLWAVWP